MLRLYTCFKTDAGSIAVPTVIMSHKINVCCCSTASTFSLHPPFQKLLHSLLSAFRSSGAYPFFVRFFFFSTTAPSSNSVQLTSLKSSSVPTKNYVELFDGDNIIETCCYREFKKRENIVHSIFVQLKVRQEWLCQCGTDQPNPGTLWFP